MTFGRCGFMPHLFFCLFFLILTNSYSQLFYKKVFTMKITKSQIKRIIQEEMNRVDEFAPLVLTAPGGAMAAGAALKSLWDAARGGEDVGEALKTQDEINADVNEALQSLADQVNAIGAALEDVQFPTSEA